MKRLKESSAEQSMIISVKRRKIGGAARKRKEKRHNLAVKYRAENFTSKNSAS
jgi:hypothetical protein